MPLRRLSRLQTRSLAAAVLAVVAGSVALTLILRGPAATPVYRPSAPPLALGTATASPATPASSPAAAVPVTVRLILPTVGIDLRVIQGDGVVVPLHLAMHYPGTDQPGGGSNALFYAHAQPGMFQALFSLHPGGEIRALRSDGSEVDYKATSFEKVPYNDRAVLAPTRFDEITLLTCTSYDPYTPRYIVIGLPV